MDKSPVYYQYMYSYPHKNAYYEIEEERILNAISNLKDDNLTLYIHVPFCESKCGYCNLFSIPNTSEVLLEKYIDTVCNQIIQYGNTLCENDIKFTNLILGGGTPLILSIEQMERLFKTLEENLPIKIDEANFVIETSPNQTDLDKLLYLKNKGLNRISIGIQSFVEDELKCIYRNHKKESCYKALDKIINLKFDAVNIDLIYGIEGQTKGSLIYSINEALRYKPEEIFIYPLYIREDTKIFGRMNLNYDFQHEMYDIAVKELNKNGYIQTSMRRFVKRVNENNLSCGFEQMLSVGCGGRSYIGNLHFCEPYTSKRNDCKEVLSNYVDKDNFFKGLKGYELNFEEVERRFIIKNLGYYKGLDLKEYKKIFSKDLLKAYPIFEELFKEKLIELEGKKLRLTKKGIKYSDVILPFWISDTVKERMKK